MFRNALADSIATVGDHKLVLCNHHFWEAFSGLHVARQKLPMSALISLAQPPKDSPLGGRAVRGFILKLPVYGQDTVSWHVTWHASMYTLSCLGFQEYERALVGMDWW